ncbi:MAG: hypothetical protein JWR05_3474 [Mucilaginibacter sp.]|nr:hypothetical protein [Mucilaginibacter sp.]
MLAIFKQKKALISECFTSCYEVSMATFINAMVDHNFNGLTKSGNPNQAQLADAWDKVFTEYLAISGDTQISTILALVKDIAILTNKLFLIETIVQQMENKHDFKLADHLRSLGFRFQYEDGPELRRELELTIIQSKAILLELEQNKAELEELRKGDGEAATRQDYQLQLSALEEFKSCSIDEDKYTVARYCADIKRMKERYKPQSA